MINVLLLGDSIRQNYQEGVSKLLCDEAKVYFPKDNGRFGLYTLRYIHEWVKDLLPESSEKFDVIHFNCGLWDVLRLSNETEPMINKDLYGRTLERIVDRLRFFYPKAEIAFATTTMVIEPGFEPGIETGERKNEDIIEYNEIARNVFDDTNVKINDLWSVSAIINDAYHSDQVHFETPEGSRILSETVANFIRDNYIIG